MGDPNRPSQCGYRQGLGVRIARSLRGVWRGLIWGDQHPKSAPEWLNRATRSAGIGVWQWRIDEKELVWDDTMFELYGADQSLGLCAREVWWSCVLPEEARRLEEEERGLIESGSGDLRTMFRIRRPDTGEIRHIASQCTLEHDSAGKPVRVIGVNEDVTERVKLAERAEQNLLLADQMSRLTKVGGWRWHSGSPGPVWSVGMYAIHDLPVGTELTHEQVSQYYPPDSLEALRKAMRRAFEEGELFDIEIEVRTAIGRERWVRVIGERARVDEDGTTLIGAMQDITDQRGVLHELEAARALAEESSRSKSEFLANMSHELRTPLTSILGFAGLAMEDAESASEHLATVHRNGEHLLQVINDLLDLSKIEAGKMHLELVPTDVGGVVGELAEQYVQRAEAKGLAMRLEVDETLPDGLRTDATRLRQVLHNLLGNAVKFTDKGEVGLRVGFEPSQTPGVDATLELRVRDTGVGMSAEQMGRIFCPFEQADTSTTRRFGGSGLGLAVTQRFVGMLGGTISVESQPGEGSEFVVRMPVEVVNSEDLVSPRPSEHTSEDEHSLSKARVLVIDDGEDNRRLISMYLAKAGAQVALAGGANEGIELALPEAFDVILMDMQMPEMDGLETTQRLRARGVRTPIVAVTAHVMMGYRERCLASGCDAYLSKPIDRQGLIKLCAHLVGIRQRAA